MWNTQCLLWSMSEHWLILFCSNENKSCQIKPICPQPSDLGTHFTLICGLGQFVPAFWAKTGATHEGMEKKHEEKCVPAIQWVWCGSRGNTSTTHNNSAAMLVSICCLILWCAEMGKCNILQNNHFDCHLCTVLCEKSSNSTLWIFIVRGGRGVCNSFSAKEIFSKGECPTSWSVTLPKQWNIKCGTIGPTHS